MLEAVEIEESPSGSAKEQNQNDSFLSPDGPSETSIADLLNLVNGDAKKFIPKRSLSSENDGFPIRDGIYGKDIALEFDDDVPIRDDIESVQEDATMTEVNPLMRENIVKLGDDTFPIYVNVGEQETMACIMFMI